MSRHAMRNQFVSGALAAVLTFAPSLLIAQDRGSATAKSQATSPTIEKEPSRGGPHEGIKVHGHWSIVVKNPDGSVVSHNEFENALTSGGAAALVSLLTQAQSTAPVWKVSLGGNIGPGQSFGFLVPATVQAVNGTVVLTASQKVNISGFQLTGVDTNVNLTSLGATFTSRDLTQPVLPSTTAPGPISVQNGQTVDATVVFSFS